MEASGSMALRYDGSDPRAVTAGAVHVECAAERLDAVAQAGEAAAGVLARTPDAIVGDLEVEGVSRRGDAHADRRGLGVFLSVGEHLGAHVVGGCFDGLVKACGGQVVYDREGDG